MSADAASQALASILADDHVAVQAAETAYEAASRKRKQDITTNEYEPEINEHCKIIKTNEDRLLRDVLDKINRAADLSLRLGLAQSKHEKKVYLPRAFSDEKYVTMSIEKLEDDVKKAHDEVKTARELLFNLNHRKEVAEQEIKRLRDQRDRRLSDVFRDSVEWHKLVILRKRVGVQTGE
jgi:hypothetical protein